MEGRGPQKDPGPPSSGKENMTRELGGELLGELVSWRSTQEKYWLQPRTVRKLGGDLSLSDYQEAANTHSDPRRREKFDTVGRWMKKQGAKDETRLSALL